MSGNKDKNRWYIAGLHFECLQCSRCCSGPGEGYIWITRPEIAILAEHLAMPIGQLSKKYLKRVALRTTIIEEPITKDCIFLKTIKGTKRCTIYSVRPNQCRIWPFWPSNLSSPSAWNTAAMKCPGINRGRVYTFEQIEKLKKQKKWWLDADQRKNR